MNCEVIFQGNSVKDVYRMIDSRNNRIVVLYVNCKRIENQQLVVLECNKSILLVNVHMLNVRVQWGTKI